MADVAGWTNLTNGNVVTAVFNAYNEPLGGYLILLLYVTISVILYIRTQSMALPTIMSFIFLGSFLVTPWFTKQTLGWAILITAFELGFTLFEFFTSNRTQ